MTYNKLSFIFKRKIAVLTILFSIKTIRERLLLAIMFGFIWLIITASLLNFSLQYYKETIVLFMGGAMIVTDYMVYSDRKNKKDLLNKYEYLKPFKDENIKFLLGRIQIEELKVALGKGANDLEYLDSLIKISQAYSTQSKAKFISFKYFSLGTLILLPLSNYLNLILNEKNVIVITVFFIMIAIFIYMVLHLYHSFINANHFRHNELTRLLKELKLLAEFKY